MNDVVLFCLAAIVGVGFIFAYLACFVGKPTSLCDAKVGEVFNFEYLQPLNGERKRWRAKIVEPVVKFDDGSIQSMNRRSSYRKHDPHFERTNHLVTCETQDGEYRQFYCERAINCRKPLLHALIG